MRNALNPMIEKQLTMLDDAVVRLKERLLAQSDSIKELHSEKEDLLEKQFRTNKTVNTLRHFETEYDDLEAENSRLHKERAALRAHLSEVLEYTKALAEAYDS